MTPERKKAALYLVLTLIIGILIGSLVPAFYGRMRHRGGDHSRGWDRSEGRMDRKGRFEKIVFRIVKPDSTQASQLRSIVRETSVKIESLEWQSSEQMRSLMDSLQIKLRPVLTNEQLERLENFSKRRHRPH
ncbi:MAG: hypothetical protein K2U26_06955 [Cyclobacteriaceae bacterium]|nr:hypothetical protein [Cyclobacteriaceae bacterium]